MAKELRKSRGEELFAVAVREVFDAVAELRTDQSTEWTEELKEALMDFAGIIAEPIDLPPEREIDFEINLENALAFRQEGVSGANTHNAAHEAPAAERSDSNGTLTRIFARISHQGAVGCVKRPSPSRIST
eukprot:jgi/Tetstr1/422020/TSEL_012884.t1